MGIDWAALGNVFGVSLLASIALVGVFTLGIMGSAPRKDGGATSALVRTGAYVCYAVCAAAVVYGIYLIGA